MKTRYTSLSSERLACDGMEKAVAGSEEAECSAAGEPRRDVYRLPGRRSGSLLARLRESGASPSHACKAKVLVMDDQEIVRSILCVMLLAMGYEAQPVSDGGEAIAHYGAAKESGRPFDILIIDLNVHHGMGGKETMQRLLEMDPGVRAIVTSGNWQDPAMENFAQYGFSGVLRKPYAINELRRVLNEALCCEGIGPFGMPSAVPSGS